MQVFPTSGESTPPHAEAIGEGATHLLTLSLTNQPQQHNCDLNTWSLNCLLQVQQQQPISRAMPTNKRYWRCGAVRFKRRSRPRSRRQKPDQTCNYLLYCPMQLSMVRPPVIHVSLAHCRCQPLTVMPVLGDSSKIVTNPPPPVLRLPIRKMLKRKKRSGCVFNYKPPPTPSPLSESRP